ncbi:hypothetical protein ACP0AK_05000 [Listeria ivanovii]|uniref:Lipoprotein n=1 Tax=Listeria ivanovii (strain ATCC BAA-678 / PAM 55) TaxID=881621 RepID=G2ZD82_LISIP|nr:hypothetical protein [Listeria ivanovii]MCJ1716488.1 hypothetical protein [Listeria ivanovii]MCJ1721604.1 hypothetical protein [Listeria ivanovii]MCJ1734381.1 hypothetical protein [Listeria ivanovii]CBW85194.1 Hypothetical protein LIV_0713 [Listeria ivanovii subsp. ivanovii PAM 55]SNV38794.1 Uncharacterised protein [Listeria ivanovii subsp. ivanovii]
MIAKSRLRIAISAVALIVLCLCVGIILTACSNDKNTKEKSLEKNEIEQVKPKSGVVSYHGKYLQLADNIKELDDSSPVIVTVTKGSEKTSITRESKDSDIPTDFYTMSEVTINNIQKDESGVLKENNKIKVLEDSVENVEVDGEKFDLTIDGYKNMQEGEEYTLFLRKSTSGDNYVLTNALLSKYPVEKVEQDELFLEGGESLEETEDMKDTYQELYKEVLKE